MRLSLRRTASAALIAVLPVLALALPAAPGAAEPRPGPPGAIPGRYIVTLKPGASPDAVLGGLGATPLFTYRHALTGFAAQLTQAQAEKARTAAGVDEVEQDAMVNVPPGEDAPADSDLEPPYSGGPDGGPVDLPEETPAPLPSASALRMGGFTPWGLTRINNRALGGTGFSVKATGAKVTAYVVDSGIEFSHPDFGGRAVPGYDAIGDGLDGGDCNGHGTHVAGTVGGSYTGVARKVSLVSVRVFPCVGRTANSVILAGIDWVAGHAKRPAVANLSFAGRWSLAVNRAVEALSRTGVFPVVAAGNDNINACFVSPASSPGAFTVGAIDQEDRRAWFSDWGTCVDIHAPGTGILSAYLNGSFRDMDGTSMAAPHVTGIAALYKDTYGDASFAALSAWLGEHAIRNVPLDGGFGTVRLAAFTNGL
ncbi:MULTISPECIES: S8 family peptidase [unclassified Streptomyces]|uniref:S8 family peptidase n=1 Tax=unclassified Streptomyces TaxID=2593676 RepID=UPI00380C3415